MDGPSAQPHAKLGAAGVVASALGSSFKHVEEELARFSGGGEDAGTHALRVGIRRFLAALELATALDEGLVPPKLERGLRRLLSALSPLRDFEIQRKALAEHELEPAVRATLDRRLRRKERDARRALRRRIAQLPHERARLSVARACATLEAMPPRAPGAKLVVLGVVARRYVAFDRRRRMASEADLHDLHRVRVAFKKYRYAVELGAPLLRTVSGPAKKAMKAFQDQLGALQDSSVVLELFERTPHSRPLARELRLEQETLAARVRELLEAQAEARIPEFSQPLPK